MLKEALVSNAEIVLGEHLMETHSGYKVQKFERYGTCNAWDFLRLMLKNRLFTVWGILFSRDVFSEDMDFQAGFKRGEDRALFALLESRIQKVVLLEKVVYYYRSRPGSTTNDVSLSNFGHAILSWFRMEAYALEAWLNLSVFLLYLMNVHVAPGIDPKLVKQKIGTYLMNNVPFKSFYRQSIERIIYA